MTPIEFCAAHDSEWTELEALIGAQRSGTRLRGTRPSSYPAHRTVDLYRRACQHLSIAQGRHYPQFVLDRLELLTQDAHQLIYRDDTLDAAWIRRLWLQEIPRSVRSHGHYVLTALALFLVPLGLMGVLVDRQPSLILSLVDASTVGQFDAMYAPDVSAIGRLRTADTDWAMLGYYISHNMTVAIQCFAGGILAGVGSVFYLAWNGAFSGAIGGYLTEHGYGGTFYPFVMTHSAFELTAIVLAGAAGLRIGHAVLAPGRRSRLLSLAMAAREVIVIVYGAFGLLLLAAIIEAFWSSAPWIPPSVKYPVAIVCWAGVLGWLLRQGRHAD